MPDELLADSMYRLDLGIVNAYLLDDGTVTLVDAGTPGAADDLQTELSRAGYAVTDVDRVLITHYDFDHVGGLGELDLDAPIYAMDPDASYVDGTDSPPLTNHKGLLQRLVGLRLTRPDGPVRRVEDGETVGGFTAYHTPGHTPGHAVYHHADLGVALLGDLVGEEDGTLGTSPWLLAYSTRRTAESVRALADRDLGFRVAAMGHGDPLRMGGAAAVADLADRLG